jgi:hypothetical protein
MQENNFIHKKKKHLEAEPRLTMDYRCCGRVVADAASGDVRVGESD